MLEVSRHLYRKKLALGSEHDHNILRLKVPMNNLQRMQIDSRLNDLPNNERRDVLRQSLPPLHVLIQIITVDILRNDVDMSLAADSLLVFDDLRVRDNLHDFTLIIKGSDGLAG